MGELYGPPEGARFALVKLGGARCSPAILAGRAAVNSVCFASRLPKAKTSRSRGRLLAFVLAQEGDPDALYLVSFDVASARARYLAERELERGLCAKVGRSTYVCPSRRAALAAAQYADRAVIAPAKPLDLAVAQEVRAAAEEAARALARKARAAEAAARRYWAELARSLLEGEEGRRLARILGGGVLEPLAEVAAPAGR